MCGDFLDLDKAAWNEPVKKRCPLVPTLDTAGRTDQSLQAVGNLREHIVTDQTPSEDQGCNKRRRCSPMARLGSVQSLLLHRVPA